MSLIEDIRAEQAKDGTSMDAEYVRRVEAALLAADALVETLMRSDSWFEIDAALDVYRAAKGAA